MRVIIIYPLISTGLDSDLISAAARLVAQLRGSDFVDPSVLWDPLHQQVLSPYIALFATVDAPRNLHIDDGDNLTTRMPNSRLASWKFSLIPPPLGVNIRSDID